MLGTHIFVIYFLKAQVLEYGLWFTGLHTPCKDCLRFSAMQVANTDVRVMLATHIVANIGQVSSGATIYTLITVPFKYVETCSIMHHG